MPGELPKLIHTTHLTVNRLATRQQLPQTPTPKLTLCSPSHRLASLRHPHTANTTQTRANKQNSEQLGTRHGLYIMSADRLPSGQCPRRVQPNEVKTAHGGRERVASLNTGVLKQSSHPKSQPLGYVRGTLHLLPTPTPTSLKTGKEYFSDRSYASRLNHQVNLPNTPPPDDHVAARLTHLSTSVSGCRLTVIFAFVFTFTAQTVRNDPTQPYADTSTPSIQHHHPTDHYRPDQIHYRTWHRQLGYAEDALFERVLRDPRDSRRFYLTYRTDELRQYATRKGFYVGSLHIKPTDGSTNGYIPFPPYYIDEGTLRELLTPYGIIVTGGFVETALHTRIAGYKFAIRFHKDAIPPKSVTYNGCTMDIKYDDDLRHCKYCGRYGHLIGKCRTKAADDLHHKQRRDELRVNQYRTARHQLEVDCDTETAKLDDNYEARLTALADAYQAALIAIEGSDGCSERAHHLAEVLAEDKATMQEEHMDTQEYYSNLMLDQIAALDERFRREGGVVPPDMLGTPTESHDSAMDTMGVSEDDLLTRAVCRMSSGIMGHSPYRIAEPAVEFPPKSVPEAESSPALPVVEVVPAESPPTVIPSTADPPSGPRPVVPLIDPALVEAQTARLSADFNYLTWNKNIIQLQTDTPNITRITP